MIGCTLLALASIGALASALARNSCEESVPACAGLAYATPTDWIEAGGSLLVIFGIAGAALVLAARLPRPWAVASVATGGGVLASVLVWQSIPYPWAGTTERVLALVLVGWVAGLGALVARQASPNAP